MLRRKPSNTSPFIVPNQSDGPILDQACTWLPGQVFKMPICQIVSLARMPFVQVASQTEKHDCRIKFSLPIQLETNMLWDDFIRRRCRRAVLLRLRGGRDSGCKIFQKHFFHVMANADTDKCLIRIHSTLNSTNVICGTEPTILN